MKEVWENVVGGHSGYWANSFRNLTGGGVQWYRDEHYAEPNPQTFKVHADDEWHIVTPEALVNAYNELKRDGWEHCDGCDIDEEDGCTGDAILQWAIFGDLVYG
jgi:hypothetical protein